MHTFPALAVTGLLLAAALPGCAKFDATPPDRALTTAPTPPEQARRIAEKLEWHDTPKHGSWLNVAECELAPCRASAWTAGSGRRPRLSQVVTAWVKERNEREVGVNWRFTTADARVKLRRLYPAPQKC